MRRFGAALLGACFWILAAVAPALHAQVSTAPAADSLGAPTDPLAPAAAGAADTSRWEAIGGARVTVHHDGREAALARRMLAFLEEQPPLPALPPEVPSGVEVFLAPDPGTFAALAGGAVPEWSGGVAVPSLGRIVMPVYGSQRGLAGRRLPTLRHEWAHLGLAEYLEGLRIPRWFHEGYAEWASGWDRSEVWRLRLLLALGRAPPLDSLSLEWPRDAQSARAAYLLSATALEYLVEASGERGLARMLERWRAGGSLDEALRATYGVTQAQLEEHWRDFVKRRYGWALVLTHSLVMWGLFALVLLLLLRVRRRRDRERLARLRAVEPSDAPAYWVDEGEGSSGPGAPTG